MAYTSSADAAQTDQAVCASLVESLGKAKKFLFDCSDLCFSLQVASSLLPALDRVRDDTDIFSDEIKVRHLEFKTIVPEVQERVTKTDAALMKGAERFQKDIETLYLGILNQTKAQPKDEIPAEFWREVAHRVRSFRESLRLLVILFREREALMNLKPASLEKTFRAMQAEIRARV